MSIANCSRCHQVFKKLYDRKVCPDCIQEEEDAYRRVVDYLEEHPGVALRDLAAGAQTEEKTILRFIRDGRITMADELAGDMLVDCKRCGTRIGSGHYCQKCLNEVGSQLREPLTGGSGQDEKFTSRTRAAETIEEKRGGDSSRRPDRR